MTENNITYEEILEKLGNKENIKEENLKENSEIDISDFIFNSNIKTIKRENKALRIIAVAVMAFIIIGLCIVAAVMSSSGRNSLYGSWISTDNIKMNIKEDYITIGEETKEYIFPDKEKNVIAIKVNNEYFKIMYRLEDDRLYFIIPLSEEKSNVIEYKRVEG
ncbi:MAG: hypothetical protein IKT78_04955 [Ruminiclostridium sp.]|nr:hypothetical protein [Ruminiclostridium sp.]